MSQMISVSEAARTLRVCPETVRGLIHNGKLPAVKVGRQYRIKAEDLQAMLAGR